MSGKSVTADCSSFVRVSIDAKLADLRKKCALARESKRTAFGRRWALSARSTKENACDFSPSDLYWDERQSRAQSSSLLSVDEADKALADFVAEHRALMGPDWIGNDHGRLCWASFLGGLPIDRHYCQDEENHTGFCQGDKGAWPQGVHDEAEWWRRKKSCDGHKSIEWMEAMVCSFCGQPVNQDS